MNWKCKSTHCQKKDRGWVLRTPYTPLSVLVLAKSDRNSVQSHFFGVDECSFSFSMRQFLSKVKYSLPKTLVNDSLSTDSRIDSICWYHFPWRKAIHLCFLRVRANMSLKWTLLFPTLKTYRYSALRWSVQCLPLVICASKYVISLKFLGSIIKRLTSERILRIHSRPQSRPSLLAGGAKSSGDENGKNWEHNVGRLFAKACNQVVLCSFFDCQNLADIVAKQQKLKYYTQLKSGRYTPLCKTPETLEAELQKQRARLQSLMTIVDRLNQEFPQAQPALRKITLSLGYRGIPEEATA